MKISNKVHPKQGSGETVLPMNRKKMKMSAKEIASMMKSRKTK